MFVVATEAKTEVRFEETFGVMLENTLAFREDSINVSSGVIASVLGSNDDCGSLRRKEKESGS